MAKLHFNYATMNAGKSIDLIRTAYNYEEIGFKVIVLKPILDTNSYISSRIGLKRKADYLIDGSVVELGDSLTEIQTICECGNIARMVGRKVNGKYMTEGSEVVIDGSNDKVEYVPFCGKCYFKKVLKKDFKILKKELKRR